jgi:CubicO group peptidase (beta-lactamase class C family)
MIRSILSLGSVLLVAACALETPVPGTAELDSLLSAAVESRQVPMAVAMVATPEGVVYQGAMGVPADAIFAIASMTKPVTAVAVMQLVEAGKVQLDDPAENYVPQLRGVRVLENGRLRRPTVPPTVRQLLNHTSGFAYEFLNRTIADYVQAGKVVSAFTGTDEFLRAPLVADPGGRWEYGISTDWLGRLVEAVSGESLDAYFRSKIFEPLGMADTHFEVPADKQSRMVPNHQRQPDGSLAAVPPQPPQPVRFYSGGGGLFSTGADYLRFARALLGGGELDGHRILSAQSVELMGQNQIGDMTVSPPVSLNPVLMAPDAKLPGRLDAFGLGFGLNREPLESGRGAGSMSWAGIFNTWFWVDRQQGITAVLLTQMLPFADPGSVRLVEDFDRAVYRVFP